MRLQIKHILRFAVLLTIGLVLAGGFRDAKLTNVTVRLLAVIDKNTKLKLC
jgi:hypothetical protein